MAEDDKLKALIEDYRNTNYKERVEIVRSIGRLKTKAAMEFLIGASQTDKSFIVRMAAVLGLENFEEDGLSALARCLEYDPNERVRAAALFGIGIIGLKKPKIAQKAIETIEEIVKRKPKLQDEQSVLLKVVLRRFKGITTLPDKETVREDIAALARKARTKKESQSGPAQTRRKQKIRGKQ